jgi:hypothetical protein
MKRILAAAFATIVGVSCGLLQIEDDDDDGDFGGGFARRAVKTGHDNEVDKVNAAPRATTIAALRAIAAPSSLSGDSARFTYAGSPEIQTWRLTNVGLTGYKRETDGDYHLVLQDGPANSLIAEIPDPLRVGESWKGPTSKARTAFDARHAAGRTFQTARETVTVTGVGFFDFVHGQIGVAPNGIELHAVLDICWGPDCASTPALTAAAGPP